MLPSADATKKSKGIRISGTLIFQSDDSTSAAAETGTRHIVLKPAPGIAGTVRTGWYDIFRQLYEDEKTELPLCGSSSTEAFEWEW